jgi:hypothetical protein
MDGKLLVVRLLTAAYGSTLVIACQHSLKSVIRMLPTGNREFFLNKPHNLASGARRGDLL